mmetsp:Transcript_15119/g.37381  ORF Transcript_15119/g.37381 Transcript_15119/m.37381 type:complete len:251 (-) Transcript_15119:1009-1761(-)
MSAARAAFSASAAARRFSASASLSSSALASANELGEPATCACFLRSSSRLRAGDTAPPPPPPPRLRRVTTSASAMRPMSTQQHTTAMSGPSHAQIGTPAPAPEPPSPLASRRSPLSSAPLPPPLPPVTPLLPPLPPVLPRPPVVPVPPPVWPPAPPVVPPVVPTGGLEPGAPMQQWPQRSLSVLPSGSLSPPGGSRKSTEPGGQPAGSHLPRSSLAMQRSPPCRSVTNATLPKPSANGCGPGVTQHRLQP